MTQVVDVFIASPRDVQTERRHAEDVIRLVSTRVRDLFDIVLNSVSWPNFLPSATRDAEERVQDRFTSRVRKCGIFIGILHERYGTEIDSSRRLSGTEEEFNAAIIHRNTIEILTYFRTIDRTIKSDPDTIEQIAKLQTLQKHLKEEGLLYQQYDQPAQFRERFVLDLFEAVIRIRTDAEKRDQLAAFFRFGTNQKQDSPSVLLAYPPIHKHIQQPLPPDSRDKQSANQGSKYNWQQRLLPNVVYEDVKCIQKIESAVRLTGVQDISAVTIDHPRLMTEPGNRIWLCLPRNDIASRNLATFEKRTWFKFDRKPQEERPHIVWKPNGKAAREIQSPMFRYLELQKRPKQSYWDARLGEIVARDYAIVARFSMKESRRGLTRKEPFYAYFVAGIRGLGTWGAGWFIDRRPDEILRITRNAEKKDFDPQVLLEVTYSNFRIFSVEDVSDRDQRYFHSQGEDGTILSVIERFK